jgi:hypothetical protein
MPGGIKINHRREQAIAALLAEPTLEAAATRAKVSVRTLKAWLRDDGFRKEYRECRRRLVEGAIGRIQAAAGKAVACLERNMDCGKPGDEIRASLGLLEHAVRGVEIADLAERLEHVERLLAEGREGHDDEGPTATSWADRNGTT